MLNFSVIPKCKAFLLMVVCFLSLYSCKKAGPKPALSNSAAIIGKWILAKQTTRVYSASGALLRDTTDAFGVILPGVNSYQTFNKDGSSVSLNNADTTGIYTYTISGSVLTNYPTDDPGTYNLYNIISLNETNMELESISINQQSNILGLDPTLTYTFFVDSYFNRD